MFYYVYIMADETNSIVYTDMTRDLVHRVQAHRYHRDPTSFTSRYHVHKLVYFEPFAKWNEAIEREAQIKNWPREKKDRLIEEMNPDWEDLYKTLICRG